MNFIMCVGRYISFLQNVAKCFAYWQKFSTSLEKLPSNSLGILIRIIKSQQTLVGVTVNIWSNGNGGRNCGTHTSGKKRIGDIIDLWEMETSTERQR